MSLTDACPAGPLGRLAFARAHWVLGDILACSPDGIPGDATFALHHSASGDLRFEGHGVVGSDAVLTLTPDLAGLPASVQEKFRHLAGFRALRIADEDLVRVPWILEGQFALSIMASDGTVLDATSIQIPGVLDDLFAYDGPLGIDLSLGCTLRLWAPTARSVHLLLCADAEPATPPTRVAMAKDPASGVWSATGGVGWLGKYYQYEIVVWAPSTGRFEINRVTDPYSLSLAADSTHSQIVDLNDAALRPEGWRQLRKPTLSGPEAVTLYELHVRDFSWGDSTVPEEERGTFRAFTAASAGGEHLRRLARAGLSHVHLLPAFDLATIPERRADQAEPDLDQLAALPPDSEQQQAAIAAIADHDGFNWGYDPWHYTVPEGSYSTNPNSPRRILEFRQMVQALAEIGLRVVMDVVYNHTYAAGQEAKSVLDKIVPGYYHRLNADGVVERSSCCPNTAVEHRMMEKLMLDSLLTWARDYKVDGFRFDLMGHHPKSSLLEVRRALDALTREVDGVDGCEIFLYGEGWSFGEIAGDARFEQASLANMAGTGIGTFNDRIRDAIRGGGPFGGLQEQGFASGLFHSPNGTDQGGHEDQVHRLRQLTDWLRISLTGSLRHYPLIDRFGHELEGWQIDYNGQPAGYTLAPQESIQYAAAHDNQTLFDALQLKLPRDTALHDRVRLQNLANALIALGQGIPFFHAGQDMLRSKSLDRDSYNSGDWFNALDYTYQANGWGRGLPPASKNREDWPLFGPFLADPALRPDAEHIRAAARHLREMLRIRRSSPLFYLPSGAEVIARLRFLNTGPHQTPGLIVMSLADPAGELDSRHEMLVVLFNATPHPQRFAAPSLPARDFELHEVQQASADPVVATSSWEMAAQTFVVPARTTVVFVARRY
ncbi:MAG: pullulanase-type alpha-1,6-glucosidase [Acidobacteriota bacterium]